MVLLISACLLMVLSYCYLSGREIGFSFLFSFGVLFYILIPYIIYEYGLFEGYPGIKLWKEHFRLAHARYEWICFYFFLCSCIVVFVDFLCLKVTLKRAGVQMTNIGHIGGTCSLIFIAMMLFYLWIKSYQAGALFKGYAVSYETGLMGNMATANLFANFMAIYFFLVGRKKLSVRFMLLIVVNSMFLLSMGGRMYVVTIIIPWFILLLSNKNSLCSRSLIMFMISFLVLFMSVVGIWRLGMSDVSFIGYITMAEAIFTSISISTFLHHNIEIPFMENGVYFISSFMGVLPSFLFSEKAQLFISPEQLGYKYESPLGATSLVVSLFTSFGYIGGIIYIFLVGVVTNIIRILGRENPFFKTYYLCVLSVVPFIYFRETFYISNRIIVFPLLIMPLAFCFIDKFMCLFFCYQKEGR